VPSGRGCAREDCRLGAGRCGETLEVLPNAGVGDALGLGLRECEAEGVFEGRAVDDSVSDSESDACCSSRSLRDSCIMALSSGAGCERRGERKRCKVGGSRQKLGREMGIV
jgi:hypothetical protein